MDATDTKSVRIEAKDYQTLKEHAEKTKRTLQYLLSRAIQRCYGKEGRE